MTRRDERFVTIRRASGHVQAEMARDILEQDGIPATIQGAEHDALLGGLASFALQIPIQVPERQAERASKLLEALLDRGPIDDQDEAGAEDEDDAGGRRSSPARRDRAKAGPRRGAKPRSARAAVAVALLLPLVIALFGAGHFYARQYAYGAIILALAAGAVVLGFGGAPWALALLPVLMALDALGAAAAIRRQNAS